MTWRLIQVLHITTGGQLIAQRAVEVDGDYLAVRAVCRQCTGRPPLAVPPALGYDAAVVLTHQPDCPRVLDAALRRDSGTE